MFRIASRCDDPGNLRERTSLDIVSELVEQLFRPSQPLRFSGARGRDFVYYFRAGTPVFEQGRRRGRGRVLIKVKQRIVREVARERVVRAVSEVGRKSLAGQILVNLP